MLAEDIKEGLPVHGVGEHELDVNDGGGCDMPVPFYLLKGSSTKKFSIA